MNKSSKGPDFSKIDSQKKAIKLVSKGELEKCFLLPIEIGGQDIPQNYVFVPIGFSKIKSDIDNNIVAPLAKEGKITEYSATPIYQGKSFIPIAIDVFASNPGEFNSRINIWGEAILNEDEA